MPATVPSDEARILGDVITALESVESEDRHRILATILTYFDHSALPPPRRFGVSSPSSEDSISSRPNRAIDPDEEASPKEFLLDKLPKTDVERVACLAYFLNRYRNIREFKTIDISKLNTEAAQIKFSNAAVAVNNASLGGYLASSAKGKKQIRVTIYLTHQA